MRVLFLCVCVIAWLAGDGDSAEQRFDVWLAFEFPAFVAREEVIDEAHTPAPGTYSIKNVASQLDLFVEDGSSTDNTPLVLSPGLHTRLFHT